MKFAQQHVECIPTDNLVNHPTIRLHTRPQYIKTLTRRAQLVCDTPDSLRDENRYLGHVFHINNYNADFIRRNTSFTDLLMLKLITGILLLLLQSLYLTLRALWDHLTESILQPYNIRVARKPYNYVTTLADQRERQGRTHQQTGSSLQDQVLWLPSFLHWWDWQKPQHKTDWTQTSNEKWWCQQSHCCTLSTDQ